MTFVFYAPDSAAARPLEGISGPGDSCGPAFMRTKSGCCLLAIGSGQNVEPTGGVEGVYGVVEYYSRVDVLRNWVESVVASR